MTGPSLLFAFLIIAAAAVVVTGSIWGGIIVAAFELGFWRLTRYLRPSCKLGQ
jgi:hypothetical protein